MARAIVCITFDFDGISGFLARGMSTPGPVSRGEFGPRVAVPRILGLLRKHDVPSSWYVPGHTLESFPDACRMVHDAGHEIGHHGWTHRPPANLTRSQEEAELARANEQIRKLTGRHARGYRSPTWDHSNDTVELLLAHGFEYDSSMMGDDYTPYRLRSGDAVEIEQPARFGGETRLIELPVSWALDDFPHFEYLRTPEWIMPGLMNAGLVLENWLDDFAYLQSNLEWGVITYTFHPFVIGRGHRLIALEKLIMALKARGAVFMQAADACAEYDRRAPFGGGAETR